MMGLSFQYRTHTHNTQYWSNIAGKFYTQFRVSNYVVQQYKVDTSRQLRVINHYLQKRKQALTDQENV